MKKMTSLLLAVLASLTLAVPSLVEARDGGHHRGGDRPGGHGPRGGPNFNQGARDFNRAGPPRSQIQFDQRARDRVHGGGNDRRPDRRDDRNINVNINRNDGGRYDHDRHHHHHHGGWDDDDDWDDHPLATAAAVTAGVAVTSAIIGSIVNTVPPNCVPANYNGLTYQRCGNTWYQPRYNGPNVQFVVVAPPY